MFKGVPGEMYKIDSPLFDLLRADAHISISKALMFAIGNDEALIYSELLSRQAYFADRGTLTASGYFFNTVADLFSGTNLTDYQQRRAINNLKKMELVDMQVRGVPPKRFFRIENNPELLLGLLRKGKEIAQTAMEKVKSTWHKTDEMLNGDVSFLSMPATSGADLRDELMACVYTDQRRYGQY